MRGSQLEITQARERRITQRMLPIGPREAWAHEEGITSDPCPNVPAGRLHSLGLWECLSEGRAGDIIAGRG
jgi:hypothetical protein